MPRTAGSRPEHTSDPRLERMPRPTTAVAVSGRLPLETRRPAPSPGVMKKGERQWRRSRSDCVLGEGAPKSSYRSSLSTRLLTALSELFLGK